MTDEDRAEIKRLMTDGWTELGKELISGLNEMEARLNIKHITIVKKLDQLAVEAFDTRTEIRLLTERVTALEGKKANGHITS